MAIPILAPALLQSASRMCSQLIPARLRVAAQTRETNKFSVLVSDNQLSKYTKAIIPPMLSKYLTIILRNRAENRLMTEGRVG